MAMKSKTVNGELYAEWEPSVWLPICRDCFDKTDDYHLLKQYGKRGACRTCNQDFPSVYFEAKWQSDYESP